jgi:hypothetical protein
MAMEDYETTDVVICGCGPTGAMLSAYLGRMSIPHIVIEKEPEITTDPRGIALDEDGIRMLQGIGIYDQIYSDIGTCEGPKSSVPCLLTKYNQACPNSSSSEAPKRLWTKTRSWRWTTERFVHLHN